MLLLPAFLSFSFGQDSEISLDGTLQPHLKSIAHERMTYGDL